MRTIMDITTLLIMGLLSFGLGGRSNAQNKQEHLSYVEDKVYHVEEDLPVEKINKLYHERWLNG